MPAYQDDIVHEMVFARIHKEAKQPSKHYRGDVGWDIYSTEKVIIPAGEMRNVPSGIVVALPRGTFGLIKGRSSTWRKRGLVVIDGVIDNGYRGELAVGVYNPGPDAQHIEVGDRLGQLIVLPMIRIRWTETLLADDLPPGDRGGAGYGSTGR